MLALVICVALSSPSAGDEAGAVSAGVAAYYSLDFAGAIATLAAALRNPELSAADRREALAFLGRAYASVREAEKATRAFADLLALEPTFAVSETESPLIQEALARAQAAAGPPMPTPTPAPAAPPAQTRETTVVAPPPDAATPFWQSSLPWAIVGVAVIVAGGVLALTRPWAHDAPPAGSLGTWSLP